MIVPIYFPTTMRATPSTPVTNVAAGSGTASGVGGLTLEQLGGLNSQGGFFQVSSSANSNYKINRIDAYSAEIT